MGYLLRGLSSPGALRLETIAQPNRSLHADAEVTHTRSQSTLPRSEPVGEDLMHSSEVGRPRSLPISQQNDARRTLTLAPYAVTCLIGAIHQASWSVPSLRRRMADVIPTLGGNRAGPHAHAGRAGPWRTGIHRNLACRRRASGGVRLIPRGRCCPGSAAPATDAGKALLRCPTPPRSSPPPSAACSAAAFASTSSTMCSTIAAGRRSCGRSCRPRTPCAARRRRRSCRYRSSAPRPGRSPRSR